MNCFVLSKQSQTPRGQWMPGWKPHITSFTSITLSQFLMLAFPFKISSNTLVFHSSTMHFPVAQFNHQTNPNISISKQYLCTQFTELIAFHGFIIFVALAISSSITYTTFKLSLLHLHHISFHHLIQIILLLMISYIISIFFVSFSQDLAFCFFSLMHFLSFFSIFIFHDF